MQVGLGWLRLPPPVFWAMTPAEFRACLEGWAELRGAGGGLAAEEVGALRRFLEEGLGRP